MSRDKGKQKRVPAGHKRSSHKSRAAETVWLYGKHACYAALSNPDREYIQLLVAENSREEYEDIHIKFPRAPQIEKADRTRLERICGADATHQGIALQVKPLRPEMPTFLDGKPYTVVILDQVTDPRNVGAVLRSAAAFGVSAVFMQERHAPPESGALAKASSGCLERVPLIRVTNITRLIETLQADIFSVSSLDIHATHTLSEARFTQRQAFLFGSEGKGARRLPSERCDNTFRLPMESDVESLNISVTAGITLYARAVSLSAV